MKRRARAGERGANLTRIASTALNVTRIASTTLNVTRIASTTLNVTRIASTTLNVTRIASTALTQKGTADTTGLHSKERGDGRGSEQQGGCSRDTSGAHPTRIDVRGAPDSDRLG